MKKIYVLMLALCGAWISAAACTNFIVGKAASTNGQTLISYAADSYTLYGFLKFQPAADHQPGEMRQINEWDTGKPLMQIPEVAHTYSVVGNMNEHQLTIGETTWGGREELWGGTGIDYGSLIYVALQRCKTAREAIECITDLVETYGYCSEGESFSIGDPNEVWIMDLIGKGKDQKGAVWVAVRVPDDCIAGHANQARIREIPVKGAKKKGFRVTSKDGQWMWHKDVVALAREKGYFADKDDQKFSFQEAYNPFDFSGLYVCEARVWSFFRHFSDDMDKYLPYASGKTFMETGGKDAGEAFPLWIKPNRKVSTQDIKDCMRDQYEGTPLDITNKTAAGPWNSKLRYGGLGFKVDSVQYWYERPTATQQTGWSFVAEMRGQENAKAGGIFWFGVDDAACTVYVPMYCRITRVPRCMEEGNGNLVTYSPTSAWWAFNMTANWAYTKYSKMYPELRREQQKWEIRFNERVSLLDEQVATLDDAAARELLTNYSDMQAEQVTAAWKELFTYLMIKYLDGQEKKTDENGAFLYNEYGEAQYPNRPACKEEYLRTIVSETAHE